MSTGWPIDDEDTDFIVYDEVPYLSQCSTLVRNTVVRAIHTVNGRLGNSTPRGPKTPEPIEMKLYMVDYVTHPTPHAQFG